MKTFTKSGVKPGMKLGVGIRALFVATLVSLVGCAAGRGASEEAEDPSAPPVSASEAIVHGALDHGRHPAVVALLANEGPVSHLCSGVLIAPDVVLTARHCVAQVKVEYIECPARVPQVGRPLAAASLAVHVGDDARSSPPAAWGRSIHTPYTDALCDADIALVTLDRPIEGIAPARLSKRASRPGDRIVAVGFGTIGDRGREGLRRFRTGVRVLAASPTELTVSESTCPGDSGGPAFDVETGEVLGVVSRGDPRCDAPEAHNVYTRVGPHLDLVERILGSIPEGTPSAPADDVGEACVDGGTCASGICAEASDQAEGYCSRPCGTGLPRCPRGHRCARSSIGPGVCARKT